MSSISRLPESTTRLLGSPLVVTTPVTLVKELLDNSIDAKATSIEVIISADTVKKIEVRDNGNGIHPDDYDALGRRGHTSKLRNFDELKNYAIKTLGFRGEALASANSLANITITTKISSEPVAAILHIQPDTGGVLKQQPTSAPVGTTVSVADLFGKLPVREQVTIKESSRTLDKICELLRSYAMARPRLRLSFKVLHSPKHNWFYSPKPDATVRETAVQLFGAELATHCFEKTFEIGGQSNENDSCTEHHDSSPNSQYLFEAFMLKPDADSFKVPKQHYFSVDGRPLTVKRGTIKKLLNIYVEHVAIALRQGSSTILPKDCFIRLNIKCPPGSYDANIEPSKDEVLFSNEDTVLDGFKSLCRETYKKPIPASSCLQLPLRCRITPDREDGTGAQESPPMGSGASAEAVSNPIPSRQTPRETALQPRLPVVSQEQQPATTQQHKSPRLQEEGQGAVGPTIIDFTPINSRISATQNKPMPSENSSVNDVLSNTRYTRCNVDMSTDFNEYSHTRRKKRPRPTQELPHLQEKQDIVEYSAPRDVNPWVIARMNAPNQNIGKQIMDGSACRDSQQLSTFESPMTPDPPILHRTEAAPRDLDVLPSQRYLHSQGNHRRLQSRLPGGPYRSPMLSPSRIAPQNATDSTMVQTIPRPRQRRNYLPWSPPSSLERVEPSISYLANAERGPTSDGMKQTILFEDARRSRKRGRPEDEDSALGQQGQQDQEMGDENGLQRMLAVARRTLNHQLSQQEAHHDHVRPGAAQSQSYTQLHINQVQEKASSSKIREPIKTSLPDCDPRAYLLRRQKSMATEEGNERPRKLRRIKSSLLPLENVPSDGQVHFLALVEASSIEALRTSVHQCVPYDRYVESGAVINGLKMNLDDGREVEDRLESLLRIQKGLDGGEEVELEIGLCSLLKGKGISTGD